MISNNLFFNAKEVSELFCVSVPMAYKLIQKMNKELKEMGYITISGKISRRYFETKVFGGLEGTEHHAGL